MTMSDFDYLPGAATLGTWGGEPYPVPHRVFDKLVEKYIDGGTFSEREKTLWDYLTDINETALMERKLALIETVEDLGISDEQLDALDMVRTGEGADRDDHYGLYAWRDHDGGDCPVAGGTSVFVRRRDGYEDEKPGFAALWSPWRWADDVLPGENIVAYRVARPGEIACSWEASHE